MINSGNERIPLQRLEPDKAKKTLGVMMSADGNMEAQIEYLKEKAEAFAINLKKPTPTTPNENWLAYVHTICKSMEYPMVTTSMTGEEWDSIFWTINKTTLPKCGFARNFTKDILYGPMKYQGMGGPMEPKCHQELEKIKTLVQEVNSQRRCGTRMQITTEQLRLETGFPGPFTDVPFHKVSPCTTDSWIKTVWAACYSYDISLHDKFGALRLARAFDQFLMPAFAKICTKEELAILNLCRLFLEVVTLADICTITGDRISRAAFQGLRQDQSLHKYNWPRHPPSLPAEHWNLWQTKIQALFTQSGSHTLRLNKPLGDWYQDPTTHWVWFYDPTTGLLYKHLPDNDYTVYSSNLNPRASTSLIYKYAAYSTDKTEGAIPCSVLEHTPGEYKILSYHRPRIIPSEPTLPTPTTLEEAKSRLDPLDQWAVETFSCKDNGASLAQLMKDGKLIAVRDGSNGDKISTSSSKLTSRS